MRTVFPNTIICCFHYIRLAIIQTLLIVLHANTSLHPKENYMIVWRLLNHKTSHRIFMSSPLIVHILA